MRVQCPNGHWFDTDEDPSCPGKMLGEVCEWSPGDGDTAERIREILHTPPRVGPEPADDVEIERRPHAADEARAALRAALEHRDRADG